MSRVAKVPVNLPESVKVSQSEGSITLTGPKGSLEQRFSSFVTVKVEDNLIHVMPQKKADEKAGWMHAGTVRALINNMVNGVTTGFEKKLELVGVGYRAQVKGDKLNLSLGFSHPVNYQLPKGVTAETEGNTLIALKSINKQLLGQAAAEIRAFRPPEPYKGKGVRYQGEHIVRKETKKK